jgi:hypothetical protein
MLAVALGSLTSAAAAAGGAAAWPLRYVFERGPWWLGGWSGASLYDVCAALSPGISAAAWGRDATHQGECAAMVDARFATFQVAALTLATGAVAVRALFHRPPPFQLAEVRAQVRLLIVDVVTDLARRGLLRSPAQRAVAAFDAAPTAATSPGFRPAGKQQAGASCPQPRKQVRDAP